VSEDQPVPLTRLASIPSVRFGVLVDHDAFNIRPVRLTHVFYSLCVFASGSLRGVLGSKAAISLQHGRVRAVLAARQDNRRHCEFRKTGPSATLLRSCGACRATWRGTEASTERPTLKVLSVGQPKNQSRSDSPLNGPATRPVRLLPTMAGPPGRRRSI